MKDLFLPALLSVAIAQSCNAASPNAGAAVRPGEASNVVAALAERAAKRGDATVTGTNGWLFLSAELRFLTAGKFWGPEASKVSRSRKPQWADPLTAIIDFNDQLGRKGITLLVVPVPPKTAIYPEQLAPDTTQISDLTLALASFYQELQSKNVKVIDLTPLFLAHKSDGPNALFCRTDSHWSGYGCVIAAQAIAAAVRQQPGTTVGGKRYEGEWKQVTIDGDLRTLSPEAVTIGMEKIAVRQIAEHGTGRQVQSDPNSELVLLGDSHTLVFHDFLAKDAGLADQLAFELGIAPELIGTRGSGATAVRLTFYRRTLNDPNYLKKKRVVVWCFAAREFTESEQGWVPEPISPPG